MAISLSDQPQPKPSSQIHPSRSTVPVQVTDDLPMYRDISLPSAPTYEPIPEPEYTNPQVSSVLKIVDRTFSYKLKIVYISTTNM